MGCNGTINSLKIKTKKHLQARNMFFNSEITNMATIQCHGLKTRLSHNCIAKHHSNVKIGQIK